MPTKAQKGLAEDLWDAQTAADIKKIVDAVKASSGALAIPVGRPNNIGTIRMASDPGLALVERVTNGIDSLLELGVLLAPRTQPTSPEEAARLLYGIPAGGLGEMSDSNRRSLAHNLVISMHESGDTKHPTIRIQDAGIGQHPDDFAGTLMSLNESNKVGKPYTMGTYGQGGSVTFGFSEYTVIISRRHPNLLQTGQADEVGWTIVYEEETDPTKNVEPRYVWLVKPDGTPFTLPSACFPDLPNGTRITHIRYDVQSLRGPFTTQMWQFLHATLFDPVLPFILTGDRKNDPKGAKGQPDSRVIIGNAARLSNVERARGELLLAATDTHTLFLGSRYGSVRVTWWALTRPEGSSSMSGPAEAYVQANNAVSITLHGQRQDAMPRTWIKDTVQFPFLYKNMVVHIDATGLTPVGRRELFSSTRERATLSELRKLIYENVADLMRIDEDLKRLNREEKENLLRRSTAATNEKVRKRLGKFIKTKLKGTKIAGAKGSGSGSGGASAAGGTDSGTHRGKPPGGGGNGGGHRSIDDSHLSHVPSYIKFDSKKVRVVQGAAAYVWVLIDAKNNYLPNHDDTMTISFTGDAKESLGIRSRSTLLGGKSRWAIHAAPDTPLGKGTLDVELITSNGPLYATVPLEVAKPTEPNRAGTAGQDEDTGPDVQWVNKDSWERLGITQKSVGRVDEDPESTIIWVNRDYALLDRALSSRGLTADQIQTRADRYQFPVACGLWLQHHDLKTTDPRPDDAYLESEMERLAEAVLVAMNPDVELAGVEGED